MPIRDVSRRELTANMSPERSMPLKEREKKNKRDKRRMRKERVRLDNLLREQNGEMEGIEQRLVSKETPDLQHLPIPNCTMSEGTSTAKSKMLDEIGDDLQV